MRKEAESIRLFLYALDVKSRAIHLGDFFVELFSFPHVYPPASLTSIIV